MSLDVYLTKDTHEDCPYCEGTGKKHSEESFSANITHNMVPMAEAVGLYKPLWRPEEVTIQTARDLVPFLQAGLKKMNEDKDELISKYSPENGWGDYDALYGFVQRYLAACLESPNALVKAWR